MLDRKANPALQDNQVAIAAAEDEVGLHYSILFACLPSFFTQFGYSAIDVAASEDIRTLLASKVRMSGTHLCLSVLLVIHSLIFFPSF